MPETQNKLDVNQDQMDMIEAALHTQSKILNMQAEAGGSGARDKLNEIKSLLALLGQQKKRQTPRTSDLATGWFCMTRSLP
jgi:hypothetical protein